MIIETRISQYRFAEMDEDTESTLKQCCKNFARDMRYDMEFEYYSVYWEKENWLLAKLAMPEIEYYLKEHNGSPNK